MHVTDLNLFPVKVKILDFDDDAELNARLLELVSAHPEFNDSTSERNLLLAADEGVARVWERFDLGLRLYLRELGLEAPSLDVDAYMFANYSRGASFTPYHNHLGEADLVAIYYAQAPGYEHEDPAAYYYAMDEGLLVLHDPRPDAFFDRRDPTTDDHYKIYPRPNRMVIHPASLAHSVTPSRSGTTRLAITCTFLLERSNRLKGYTSYRMDLQEETASPPTGSRTGWARGDVAGARSTAAVPSASRTRG